MRERDALLDVVAGGVMVVVLLAVVEIARHVVHALGGWP